MKVRARALRRIRGDDLAHGGDLAPGHTGPIHSRIDHQMPRLASRAPSLDAHPIAQDRTQLGAASDVKLGRENRRKDEDGLFDASGTQLLAFLDRRDTKPPRIYLQQRLRDSNGAESIA